MTSEELGMESPPRQGLSAERVKSIHRDHNQHFLCLPCVGHCAKLITMPSHFVHAPPCQVGIISSVLKMQKQRIREISVTGPKVYLPGFL